MKKFDLTKADIDAMFPDCGHRHGLGTSDHDRNRCEGMIGLCERRRAHRAGVKLFEAIQKLLASEPQQT